MVRSKKSKNKNRGFSIMEVILATFVVGAGLVAAMQLISASLIHSMDARDHQVAILLAQEGSELVKNLRDNVWARSKNINNNNIFPNVLNPNHSCQLDYLSNNINNCNNNPDAKILNYNSINNAYVHNTAYPATKFKRMVKLQYLNNAGSVVNQQTQAVSIVVTTVVIWGGVSFPTTVDVSTCDVSRKCVFVKNVLTAWGE